jgi:hypothetical protein
MYLESTLRRVNFKRFFKIQYATSRFTEDQDTAAQDVGAKILSCPIKYFIGPSQVGA